MKNKYLKRLCGIICLIFTAAFICSPAYAEETETTTVTVNVSLPADCDYTDDGITMVVSVGYSSGCIAPGSGVYKPGDGHIGYDGIIECEPSSREIMLRTIQSKNITFSEGETEISVEFVLPKTSIKGSLYAYYSINDDRYMGRGYRRADNNVELAVNCIKKITLSGTITLTGIDEDVPYVIYVNENRIAAKEAINYDGSARVYGKVPAETGTSAYSFEIEPDTAYTLTVMFENHDFVYQQKKFTTVDEDMTVDFSDFVRSPVITGTIKLPDSVTSDTDVLGYVHLQSAEAPYYETNAYMKASFDFSGGRECKFSALNDLGADKLIVYYTVRNAVEGLYYGGNYLNDTTCVKDVSDAAVIDGSGGNIILNMLESGPYPLEVSEPYITADNKYAVDVFNRSFYSGDMTVYLVNYDNNGVLTNITKEPFYVSRYYPESFEFEKTDGKQSIFIWSGMKPAALETKIN